MTASTKQFSAMRVLGILLMLTLVFGTAFAFEATDYSVSDDNVFVSQPVEITVSIAKDAQEVIQDVSLVLTDQNGSFFGQLVGCTPSLDSLQT